MNNIRREQNNFDLELPTERLRYLRWLTRLTRKDLAQKYNFPTSTLRAWEQGTTPLSNKGIMRCIDIFQQEGIIVTEEWLKDGVGPKPLVNTNIDNRITRDDEELYLLSHTEGAKNIIHDIKLFRESYPNSITHVINDDSMLPIYKIGDVVCGIQQPYNLYNLIQFNHKDCIVLLNSGQYIFRKFIIAESGSCNLTSTNSLTTVDNPIIFDAQIQMIAPIRWHIVK